MCTHTSSISPQTFIAPHPPWVSCRRLLGVNHQPRRLLAIINYDSQHFFSPQECVVVLYYLTAPTRPTKLALPLPLLTVNKRTTHLFPPHTSYTTSHHTPNTPSPHASSLFSNHHPFSPPHLSIDLLILLFNSAKYCSSSFPHT